MQDYLKAMRRGELRASLIGSIEHGQVREKGALLANEQHVVHFRLVVCQVQGARDGTEIDGTGSERRGDALREEPTPSDAGGSVSAHTASFRRASKELRFCALIDVNTGRVRLI